MKKILLAGATGYLGSYIARELIKDSGDLRVIVRSPDKLHKRNLEVADIFRAEVTQLDSITGCCEGIDTVISTVGITRQKDGLTYMDVDLHKGNGLRRGRLSGSRSGGCVGGDAHGA